VAQIFPNDGLNYIFTQLSMGGTNASAVSSTYYAGLLAGGTATSVPAATAVLGTLGGTFTEVSGTGYVRQTVAFSTGATSNTAVLSGAAITAGGANASWVVTVASNSGVRAGMTATLSGGSGSETKIVTNVVGSTQIVLSSAIGSGTQTTITVGDLYAGRKVYPASAITFGPALSAWTASTGYFIATSSDNTGKLLYVSNFADGTTPTLAVNDTLTVTPTILLSN
jgi:hypothetical protein